MGLLSDFYNTVAKFFRTQEEPIIGDASKAVATNRLKLVLMQDRTNLTPKILEQMRGELVELLSKYLEMDKDSLELNFEHEGDQVALMLSIPVIRAKDEDEIEEALKNSSIVDEETNELDEDNDEESEEDEVCEEDEVTETDELFEDNAEISDSADTDNVSKKTKRNSKKVSNPVSQTEENSETSSNEVLSEINE